MVPEGAEVHCVHGGSCTSASPQDRRSQQCAPITRGVARRHPRPLPRPPLLRPQTPPPRTPLPHSHPHRPRQRSLHPPRPPTQTHLGLPRTLPRRRHRHDEAHPLQPRPRSQRPQTRRHAQPNHTRRIHRPRQTWRVDRLQRAKRPGHTPRADPRAAAIAECRLYRGLSNDVIAETLGVSLRTVEREWSATRAWLQAELAEESRP
ncbi:MAG: hypothetical protein HND58_05175 [Planctomycetota bacterium]|nr:MAG: hypothetical protein HND58_05175 [Planctomycetota bacterium]